MKQNLKNEHGFTLVELMVVLVILGILASIAVPSFSHYIKKQNEKDAISECRQVVAASQSVYSSRYVKNVLSLKEINNDNILKIAGVNGKIQGVPNFDETSMRIIKLGYQSENGLYVTYDSAETVKYTISDTTVYGPMDQLIKDYNATIKKIVQDSNSDNVVKDRAEFTKELVRSGGSLVQVDYAFLKNSEFAEQKDKLYWQPYYISSSWKANDILDSLLFATSNNGTNPDDKNFHSGWKAYLVYFDGKIYESTTKDLNGNYIGTQIHTLKDVHSLEDVNDFLLEAGFKIQN